MRNEDVKNRFEDWLLDPREALDLEVKTWLDFTDAESKGAVAKACIALANHGGGYLVFGYTRGATGVLVPDETNRPVDLTDYGDDAINAIIKKWAEPVFHVDCHFVPHLKLNNALFPLIVVGEGKVPIRTKAATPSRKIQENCFFVRRAGPSSEVPKTGAEWDALIGRCVRRHREDLLSDLTRLLRVPDRTEPITGQSVQVLQGALNPTQPASGTVGPTPMQQLEAFRYEAQRKWEALNNGVPDTDPGKIKLGYYTLSCKISGKSKNQSLPDILGTIRGLKRYTGWSMLIAVNDQPNAPHLDGKVIQAWISKSNFPDPGHSDFWRVSQDGLIFLLRGYQEDSLERMTPGRYFDFTLPVWRVGEFLLRVAELARFMYEADYQLTIACEWSGLAGRSLVCVAGHRSAWGSRPASVDLVQTDGTFNDLEITSNLPLVVKALVEPLLMHFDFFVPPATFYEEELQEIMKR